MKTRATPLMCVTGLICSIVLALSSGCRNSERQAALHSRLTVNKVSAVYAVMPPAPLPLEAKPRPDLVVASLNKRVIGRENSQRDIYRKLCTTLIPLLWLLFSSHRCRQTSSAWPTCRVFL